MTNQLPQEIQDAIDSLAKELSITDALCYWAVYKHLGPYLSKQEDNLHDLLGKAFTILCNKDNLSEEDRLMRNQLELRLENNSMLLDFEDKND